MSAYYCSRHKRVCHCMVVCILHVGIKYCVYAVRFVSAQLNHWKWCKQHATRTLSCVFCVCYYSKIACLCYYSFHVFIYEFWTEFLFEKVNKLVDTVQANKLRLAQQHIALISMNVGNYCALDTTVHHMLNRSELERRISILFDFPKSTLVR